ncbi:hypothetical protein KMZ15_06735 [Mycoavidus sp. HKI]|uniref:hypothetical protein n=1 Tax=Mycoavidus sp. HKI TaxID=2840467 RepID=UPI001CBD545B|nr:hypothetical protein [Mycoavidus sp. HKI]UAW63759.1 hypothetical protein KMZ15_06735 [Mycoavidus sp. HKI]
MGSDCSKTLDHKKNVIAPSPRLLVTAEVIEESDPNWGLTAEPVEASALKASNGRQKSRTTLDNQKIS